MKNFKLTDETIEVDGRTLYRIECIKDFQYAKIGDKGGFVESEDNLSEEAWIGDNACVYGNARVYGNACVFGNAWVYESARVFDSARVFEDAKVYGRSFVFGDVEVFDSARVYGKAWVFGSAVVYGSAKVFGSAEVFDFAKVSSGEWSETPFQVQGSQHFVGVPSPTELEIGCEEIVDCKNFEEFPKKVSVVGASNSFKDISDSIANLLEYKNEKYGNAVLEPLNIFAGKTKAGVRLDDKLARVKNSEELRKNDVADILGYVMLICKENNWTNFDEFKD